MAHSRSADVVGRSPAGDPFLRLSALLKSPGDCSERLKRAGRTRPLRLAAALETTLNIQRLHEALCGYALSVVKRKTADDDTGCGILVTHAWRAAVTINSVGLFDTMSAYTASASADREKTAQPAPASILTSPVVRCLESSKRV